MFRKHYKELFLMVCILMLTSASLSACKSESQSPNTVVTSTNVTGTRDNTPLVLVPQIDGTNTLGNDSICINVTNSAEGYIVASYSGSNNKVKLQLTGSDEVTYTYNLTLMGHDVIPLTSSSGTYQVTVYESIGQDQYATLYSTEFNASITNELGPYLYPNQYISFNADSKVVSKGVELAAACTSDLEVVSNVYNYVISNITYDYDKAENVQSGYLPDVDSILASNTGICFDYAAVMAAMLRSQHIPTRLEIGYAGSTYHAWISVYTKDTGWINGLVEFNGHNWSLMDPTFAANTSTKELEKFMGDGNNYVTKYIY